MMNNSLNSSGSMSSAEKDKITHDRTGKLQDLAVEYFQRAYGLGDRAREDHNDLCEEAVEVTQCSRRAFRELIYGHSYQAILGPLREMVPGYKPKLPKREQREQQMQELEQSMSGTPPKEENAPRPFKLSSAAPPFESPKMLPQQAKYITTLTPTGSVISPVAPRDPSMAKPKLADRVITSPERKKLAGASPEPMDLPGSHSRSSTDYEGGRSEWGSPVMWPTPSTSDTPKRDPEPSRREKVTPPMETASAKSRSSSHDEEKIAKAKEEKSANEERVRSEQKAKEEEQRVREREAIDERAKEEHNRKEEDAKREAEFETKDDGGMIEEALRDKARLSGRDKSNKPRTPRPVRSPQLAPSLFSTPIQPPTSVAVASPPSGEPSPPTSTLMLNMTKLGVCGSAALGALIFCLLRQYVSHLADYSGRASLESLLPLLFGSFAVLAVLLHRVLHSAIKTRQLPMNIAADTEDYIEAWELLHVGGDARELVHALQQIHLLLTSLIQGLDVLHPAPSSELTGINHSVRLLDYLSGIHKKLAGDIGNTVLVMRLVDSLRRMRVSLLRLCLPSETALPVVEPLSASIVAANVVCLLVGVQTGSALFEILLLPAFVYLFILIQILLTHLDSPFTPVAPLNLEGLVYIQKRVQNRITQLQKAAE